jgi:hypothetical protein
VSAWPLKRETLLIAWAATILGVAVWTWSRVLFGSLAALAIVGIAIFAWERRRRSAREYWVEYLSPAMVRAGENDFAVVYHEREAYLFFEGVTEPGGRRLTVPSASAWSDRVPAWARDRRETILERVLGDKVVRAQGIVARDEGPIA